MMALSVATLLFSSCTDDSTEGFTRITYYPELSLEGEKTLYVDKGATFTDPRLAAAVVDRLTFNAHIINTGTQSYRLAATRTRQEVTPPS